MPNYLQKETEIDRRTQTDILARRFLRGRYLSEDEIRAQLDGKYNQTFIDSVIINVIAIRALISPISSIYPKE